jgi:flagellar motor switch protein FliN/FliY
MADNDAKGDFGAGAWPAATAERSPFALGSAQSKVFPELTGDVPMTVAPGRLDMILDIPVQVTVELGRSKIPIRNLLQLVQGSVVELDRLAGEPLDVLVNGCLIAQGEVVVVDDKFGIRLTDVISPDERLRRLHR